MLVQYRGFPEDGSGFLCNAGVGCLFPRQPPVKQATTENLPGCNFKEAPAFSPSILRIRGEQVESSSDSLYCFVTVSPSPKIITKLLPKPLLLGWLVFIDIHLSWDFFVFRYRSAQMHGGQY